MPLEYEDAARPRGQRRRLLDDPRSMRALAHPLRLELEAIVGRSGRITTADAARELGISHGLASHHLHQLAKYGFVEQVSGADNRERPWRLVATSVSYEGLDEKPGGPAAVAAFEQGAAERTTESELGGLVGAIEKLILEYVDERPLDDLSARPPDAVPVEFGLFVVPCEPLSGGG